MKEIGAHYFYDYVFIPFTGLPRVIFQRWMIVLFRDQPGKSIAFSLS